MLSWERRHLDELWFHKRGESGGAAPQPPANALLLESDTGSGFDFVQLESGTTPLTDALLLESA
jgi:hypothetical protein